MPLPSTAKAMVPLPGSPGARQPAPGRGRREPGRPDDRRHRLASAQRVHERLVR